MSSGAVFMRMVDTVHVKKPFFKTRVYPSFARYVGVG